MSDVLKFRRTYTLSPVEFIKFQLNQAINFPIPNLNETDITILAYIYLYKLDAKDKIVKDRILTSITSCHNYFVKLKHMQYILKTEEGYVLNPQLKIIDESFIQINDVNLDLSNSNVNHPYFKK